MFNRLEDDDAPCHHLVIRETAPKLIIAAEMLQRWVEQAEVYAEKKQGVPDAQEQIRQLKRENAELCRANEILKTASLDSSRQSNTAFFDLDWDAVA